MRWVSPAIWSSRTWPSSAARAGSDNPGSEIDQVGLRKTGDSADADDTPFRVIGDHHQPTPRVHECPVCLRLEHVGSREASPGVHAMDTHEHEIHVHGAQRRYRERSGQGVRGGADPPVSMTVWSERPP